MVQRATRGSGNLNDQMMEKVSDAGNGMYALISSTDQADNYAQNRLLSTLVHVAKDMKIQVEFNPAQVAAYRLLGYEDRAIADMSFRNDAVDGGEVGAGHRMTALYELVPAGQPLALKPGQPAILDGALSTAVAEVAASDMVKVKVRWKGLDATDATPASEVSASLAPEHCSNGIAVADPDLRWAAGVAAFAEMLKKSPFADPTFLPEIDAVVAAQAARDGDRTEFAQLYQVARTLLPPLRRDAASATARRGRQVVARAVRRSIACTTSTPTAAVGQRHAKNGPLAAPGPPRTTSVRRGRLRCERTHARRSSR